jgi:hypothetical protein
VHLLVLRSVLLVAQAGDGPDKNHADTTEHANGAGVFGHVGAQVDGLVQRHHGAGHLLHGNGVVDVRYRDKNRAGHTIRATATDDFIYLLLSQKATTNPYTSVNF